jgi:hypothetical protein
MSPAERLNLIEWYAERGWALLPLAPRDKKPRANVAKGWSSYRLPRGRVRATFADGCNVGVLLGEPSCGSRGEETSPSAETKLDGWRRAVLGDIPVNRGSGRDRRCGWLPMTAVVETPSGKGREPCRLAGIPRERRPAALRALGGGT